MSGVTLLAFASVALAASHGLRGLMRTEAPPAGGGESSLAASFEATMKPVLMDKCSPCHAPGGRMHARLPFDDAATVASHPEGIRERLKGDDLKAFEAWLTTQQK